MAKLFGVCEIERDALVVVDLGTRRRDSAVPSNEGCKEQAAQPFAHLAGTVQRIVAARGAISRVVVVARPENQGLSPTSDPYRAVVQSGLVVGDRGDAVSGHEDATDRDGDGTAKVGLPIAQARGPTPPLLRAAARRRASARRRSRSSPHPPRPLRRQRPVSSAVAHMNTSNLALKQLAPWPARPAAARIECVRSRREPRARAISRTPPTAMTARVTPTARFLAEAGGVGNEQGDLAGHSGAFRQRDTERARGLSESRQSDISSSVAKLWHRQRLGSCRRRRPPRHHRRRPGYRRAHFHPSHRPALVEEARRGSRPASTARRCRGRRRAAGGTGRRAGADPGRDSGSRARRRGCRPRPTPGSRGRSSPPADRAHRAAAAEAHHAHVLVVGQRTRRAVARGSAEHARPVRPDWRTSDMPTSIASGSSPAWVACRVSTWTRPMAVAIVLVGAADAHHGASVIRRRVGEDLVMLMSQAANDQVPPLPPSAYAPASPRRSRPVPLTQRRRGAR